MNEEGIHIDPTPPPAPKKPRRTKKQVAAERRQVPLEKIQALHTVVSPAIGFVMVLAIPDPDKRMTEAERREIFNPLEAIAIRHGWIPDVTEVDPDVRDLITSGGAFGAYLIRTGAVGAAINSLKPTPRRRPGQEAGAGPNPPGARSSGGGPRSNRDAAREGARAAQTAPSSSPDSILSRLWHESQPTDNGASG